MRRSSDEGSRGFSGWLAIVLIGLGFAATACSGELNPSHDGCDEGRSSECQCADGQTGVQVCQADQTWGACSCELAQPDAAASDAGEASDGDSHKTWRRADDPEPILVAKNLLSAPTVDGELEESLYGSAMRLEVHDPTGASDNRLRAWALWDDDNLYVAAEVDDDELEYDAAAETYRNDGVELFIDTLQDGGGGMRADDYHVIIALQGQAVVKQGSPQGQREVDDVAVEHAIEQREAGYTVEVAIPWHAIDVAPVRDQIFGFLLTNTDRADGQYSQFAWGGVTEFGHPDNWHNLRLGGNEPDGSLGDHTGDAGSPQTDSGTRDTGVGQDGETNQDCPALPDPPGDNIIDLGDEGLSDGDEIDGYLDAHLDNGNEVHIPAGTYQWNGGGVSGDLSDSSIVGEGEVFFDVPDGYNFDPTFASTGAFEIRNITIKGKAGDDGKTRFYPRSPDAKVVARNFNQPDGSEDGRRVGMYVPRDAEGEAHFIDCHVEGFANNGLYASSPGYADGGGGAEIHVLRGLYKNNNIAGVRIGSSNSSVIGTVIVNDAPSPLNRVSGGKNNQRGLRVRAAGDNIHIENVDITQSESANGAIAYHLDVPGGSGTIIDTRIQNDISKEPIDVPSDAGEWTGDNIHITGNGDLATDNIDITNLCTGSGCDAPRTTARSRCP